MREAVGESWQDQTAVDHENGVVAVLGGFAGLAMTALALGFITEFASIYTPLSTEFTLDARLLGFCLTLTLVIGLASALIASAQKRDINRALKVGGGQQSINSARRRTYRKSRYIQWFGDHGSARQPERRTICMVTHDARFAGRATRKVELMDGELI